MMGKEIPWKWEEEQEWAYYIILRDYKSETFKGDSNDHLIINGQLLKKIMATRYKLSIGVATYIKPLLHRIIWEENMEVGMTPPSLI